MLTIAKLEPLTQRPRPGMLVEGVPLFRRPEEMNKLAYHTAYTLTCKFAHAAALVMTQNAGIGPPPENEDHEDVPATASLEEALAKVGLDYRDDEVQEGLAVGTWDALNAIQELIPDDDDSDAGE